MTPEERATIQAWGSRQRQQTLTLATAQNDASDRMGRFCDRLAELAPALTIKKEADETGFTPPAIIMGTHQNIACQALPEGKILELFLSSIQMAAEDAPPLEEQMRFPLEQINLPVNMKLYIAAQCPHCPGTLKGLLPLACANGNLRLTFIDAQGFEQAAQADEIRSVPTLIVDDRFRWSGPMDLKEVLCVCIQRNPAQLSAGSLRQLMEDGQAPRVARMIVEADTLFPALLELLVHERWSVRLGAMVVAEYLAEEAPHIAIRQARQLWQGFSHYSDPVRGDVLHVFGQIDSPVTRGYLNSVLNGPYHAGVKEAAQEALKTSLSF